MLKIAILSHEKYVKEVIKSELKKKYWRIFSV